MNKIQELLKPYLKEISTLVEKENDYLDNMFKDSFKDIKLDIDQKRCIVCDKNHLLIIAGAGSGKTMVLTGKVKYLIERCNVDPQKILIFSFTNKAVNELKERINETLNLPVAITTFHSFGYNLIKKRGFNNLKIASNDVLIRIINQYLKEHILNDYKMVAKVVIFLSFYLFSIDCYNNHRLFEDEKKLMRTKEEVLIGNFLYLHGIDYDYDYLYPYQGESIKEITTDFHILNKENGKDIFIECVDNKDYEDLTLKKELKEKVWKTRLWHYKHNTDLILITSNSLKNKSFLFRFKEQIEKRLKLNVIDYLKVYKKHLDNNTIYIKTLVHLLSDFITQFKTFGYSSYHINEMIAKEKSKRNILFLELAYQVYQYYNEYLISNEMIDFQDMINKSTYRLNELDEKYDYIFIDEYQDISRQRFMFMRNISKQTNAKIVAVGDDWQCATRF